MLAPPASALNWDLAHMLIDHQPKEGGKAFPTYKGAGEPQDAAV